ncbi:MAG: curli assembly protein CsgF [Cyclobacteriaceae bacterium]|nr:curli assembly protein CsgF [Cyclobacteriaceae bacterium]
MKLLICLLITLASGSLFAQDLKYKPINPAFGGDTFNYNWLLSQAQAQNDFAEDPNANPFGSDPLADFQSDLNRQILSQLSRALVGDLFDADGRLNEGVFEIGSYQIEIVNGIDGISIGILDILTGSTTTVTVPTF